MVDGKWPEKDDDRISVAFRTTSKGQAFYKEDERKREKEVTLQDGPQFEDRRNPVTLESIASRERRDHGQPRQQKQVEDDKSTTGGKVLQG